MACLLAGERTAIVEPSGMYTIVVLFSNGIDRTGSLSPCINERTPPTIAGDRGGAGRRTPPNSGACFPRGNHNPALHTGRHLLCVPPPGGASDPPLQTRPAPPPAPHSRRVLWERQ